MLSVALCLPLLAASYGVALPMPLRLSFVEQAPIANVRTPHRLPSVRSVTAIAVKRVASM